MALKRYTTPIDGSIPVPALLYNDEDLIASQDNVGIYDGLQKAQNYQSGTIHVSSHRLFYVDSRNEATYSFALDLSSVAQTEHYAGLFKSSPKVTLHLSPGTISSKATHSSSSNSTETAFESWECDVCAYRNPPGLSPAAARICGLCGVPRQSLPVKQSSSQHLSTSLPSTPPHLTATSNEIACPACTFLNHPSLRECEICGTRLPPRRDKVKSAPSSRPASPDPEDSDSDNPSNTAARIIKISFRKGGDKPFYAVLKRSLKAKAWEARGVSSVNTDSEVAGHPPYDKNTSRSGISGILRTVETSAQGREVHMKDALTDLEALMVKAKDMVRLAADLNERLTAVSAPAPAFSQASSSTGTTEPEEATFIRSSLSQLGLQMANAPVTLDMMKDERKWFDELARELAGILQGSGSQLGTTKDGGAGMMKHRGVIALDEVWGGWNRARGVALIPPSTFLQVIPHLGRYTNPTIIQRTFPSGLSVLHTPEYSPAAFAAHLYTALTMSGPKTTFEIAMEEGMTVSLAAEMVDDSEKRGTVCRDDGSCSILEGGIGGEIRWYKNFFDGYIWDGEPQAQALVV